MDGGSRKVDEAGAYLTSSEKETLDQLVAGQSPVIAGIGVLHSTRNESANTDMSRYWTDDEDGEQDIDENAPVGGNPHDRPDTRHRTRHRHGRPEHGSRNRSPERRL